jgi:hypothetical protein
MSTINMSNPATTTSTARVVTTPTVAAPGLAAAGVETCLGSAVGGLSLMGGGFTLGSTKVDEGCTIRLLARQLYAFGLQKAALALMCQDGHVAAAMAITGTPCPMPPAPAPVKVSERAQTDAEDITGALGQTTEHAASDAPAPVSEPVAVSQPLPIATHLHLSFVLPVTRTPQQEEAWFDRASNVN